MKYLKLTLEDDADAAKIKELLLQVRGINSAEIMDESNPESELKKAFNKSKEQLKKGEYESIINDIFDILINPKSK